MEKNYKMVAKTFFGFEDILATELRNLGAMHVTKGVRSVQFEGDKGFMYKANLCLRTALKILKPIASFYIRSEKEYYQKLYQFNWQQYLGVTQTFAVTATLQTELFSHSQFVALRAKDAIVDAFRDATGKRPNVDVQHPDVALHIHVQRNEVIVSLDSSGESLHQRGYRTATNLAPINEVLAAGILLLSGWEGQSDFLDPMCGSFLIEAAMIACNIPANIHRKEFAFERWSDYDENLFNVIFSSCIKKIREFNYHITGYDKAPSAVAKAKDNLRNANLSDYIKIYQRDFFGTEKEDKDKPLHIVFNPPYNERLVSDTEQLYGSIGSTLKHHYPQSEAWFITANLEGLKYVGLRPTRKIKLFNGKLESRLVQYNLYEGSKIEKYSNDEF